MIIIGVIAIAVLLWLFILESRVKEIEKREKDRGRRVINLLQAEIDLKERIGEIEKRLDNQRDDWK